MGQKALWPTKVLQPVRAFVCKWPLCARSSLQKREQNEKLSTTLLYHAVECLLSALIESPLLSAEGGPFQAIRPFFLYLHTYKLPCAEGGVVLLGPKGLR